MDVIWQCPSDARAAVVFAHGAGAGMRHRNMQAIADALERRRVATLRFNFPFIEAGRKRVDSRDVAVNTIAAAYRSAMARSDLPIWLGGHSFGGRMTSHAVLDAGLEPQGLLFCAFPLHPAGRPSTDRADHLARIGRPMLFLSGTRDPLAAPDLLEPLVASLPHARLHWLDTADHGYRVRKRERTSDENVFEEIGRVAGEVIAAGKA